jgi:hypothetical protein
MPNVEAAAPAPFPSLGKRRRSDQLAILRPSQPESSGSHSRKWICRTVKGTAAPAKKTRPSGENKHLAPHPVVHELANQIRPSVAPPLSRLCRSAAKRQPILIDLPRRSESIRSLRKKKQPIRLASHNTSGPIRTLQRQVRATSSDLVRYLVRVLMECRLRFPIVFALLHSQPRSQTEASACEPQILTGPGQVPEMQLIVSYRFPLLAFSASYSKKTSVFELWRILEGASSLALLHSQPRTQTHALIYELPNRE